MSALAEAIPSFLSFSPAPFLLASEAAPLLNLPPDEERFWHQLASGDVAWSSRLEAAMSWQELVAGSLALADVARSDRATFLLLRPSAGTPMRGRLRMMLERAAEAEASKALAIDFGVSPAAVSHELKRGLARLGFRSRAELVWFCREGKGLEPSKTVRSARLSCGRGEAIVLAFTRRPSSVEGPFTAAERAIVFALLEGRSDAEIAHLRGGVARSTIHNQLASIRSKLGVASRYDLIRGSSSWAVAAPPPEEVPLAITRRFAQRAFAGS